MKVTPIGAPLPGEHLAATVPVMRPETVDARWRLRLDFWTGRALTSDALELEQQNRAARLAWRGRVATPGIVRGLEVALEPPATPGAARGPAGHFVHVLPGHGLLADGEDVIVPRPLRVPLDQVPLQYVRVFRPGQEAPIEAPPADAVEGRQQNAGGFVFHVDEFTAAHQPWADRSRPWAAVLVLSPAEFDVFQRVDPRSPCELDPSQDAFADQRRIDACRLRLCELPHDWQSRPNAADPTGPDWRNYLAHLVFEEEARLAARHHVRFIEEGRGWDTVLRAADLLPWEVVGVPLALVSIEQLRNFDTRGFFLDRGSVARPGGSARPRTRPAVRLVEEATEAALDTPAPGSPFNWRARVDQFAEHLASFELQTAADVDNARAAFRFVPSAGLLPRPVLNLLTTDEAMRLPRPATGPRDRAGVNHLFPAPFPVHAVPVAIEDLDTALAASAPLASYDFQSTNRDQVRILVPVPQRLFDPQLLVVEEEDPIFAATLNRFVVSRQDWRQRRDFVRDERDALRFLLTGPVTEPPPPPLDRLQLEPEPVESGAVVEGAFVSPATPPGPWEISADFFGTRTATSATRLFVRLRIDESAPPSRIEVRWRSGVREFRHTFTERPPAPAQPFDANGRPQPISLFELYSVQASVLGIVNVTLNGFTVHLDDGRIALGDAGELQPRGTDSQTPVMWWEAESSTTEQFVGPPWTDNHNRRWMLAPFEEFFLDPSTPFSATLDERIAQIHAALNPVTTTARQQAMFVGTHGLERTLAELEAEAAEADDFVDANFTRSQTNLYRVRKLVLGETAAQKLLINPAIATIAEQETAAAAAEQLGSFIRAAKTRFNTPAQVNAALGAVTAEGPPPPLNLRIAVDAVDTRLRIEAGTLKQDTLRNVRRQLPQTGPTLPPRGLSIGQRFTEPPATQNLAYARAALAELLEQLPRLRLPLVGETVRSLERQDVSLLDLQGRSRAPDITVTATAFATGGTLAAGTYSYRVTAIDALNRETAPSATVQATVTGATGSVSLNWPVVDGAATYRVYRRLGGGSEAFYTTRSGPFTDTNAASTPGSPPPAPLSPDAARARLLSVPPVTADTDEAEVTLAALDIIEVKSAILRTIERVIEERRTFISRGLETLGLVRAQHDLAASRVVAIEGRLAEARHDVSVARALRQEEQQRVTALNERRDAVIRDEVKFLAYVRPRMVDLARRSLAYWKLELFGVPAPVPACLKRHDEPPAPLNAYVQLFRHAPARWFTELEPLLAKLDTPEKLLALLDAARLSAGSFLTVDARRDVAGAAAAVQVTVLGAHQALGALRQKSTAIQIVEKRRWKDVQREVREHAAVGDLIDGRHGSSPISAAAAAALEQIARVATCLHAEFADVPPTTRLVWIERFSQFDRPILLRDLTVLPHYERLDRAMRRRLQEFADWLFKRVDDSDRAAAILINDLVRLCLLLASHAPVNRIIAGHVPRPTPVRPGLQIPIRPLNPELVRVGMEVHVWNASRIVARGRVEDLEQGEVSARMETVDAQTTTIDTTMRVQFVPAALSFLK